MALRVQEASAGVFPQAVAAVNSMTLKTEHFSALFITFSEPELKGQLPAVCR